MIHLNKSLLSHGHTIQRRKTMKKIVAICLILPFTFAIAFTVASCGSGNNETTNGTTTAGTTTNGTTSGTTTQETTTTVNRADESKSAGVMTYDQYVNADVDSKVVIEAYIQAKQVYSEQYGNTTLYLQDADGAYFVYRLACTAEDYATYTVGKKVKISGVKAVWSGEVEITDATIELLDGYYVAEAKEATALLANEEELIKLQNQLVSFKGLTVAASKDADDKEVAYLYKWNGTGAEGDDLYFNVTLDGKTYQFLVESDLCGADTDVYKAVKNLKIGDKIDVEGFLYWYNGVNPHITSVQIVK